MNSPCFFDPFSGWCYASALALAAVDEAYPGAPRAMPSGLFADGNTRPMAAMDDRAWRNDTRISELTGQCFAEAHRDAVLLKPDGVFDSGPATRPLVALGEMSPALESKFLHAIQIAHYVGARNTALPDEVASVAQVVAQKANISLDPTAFALRLTDDECLAARTNARRGHAGGDGAAPQPRGSAVARDRRRRRRSHPRRVAARWCGQGGEGASGVHQAAALAPDQSGAPLSCVSGWGVGSEGRRRRDPVSTGADSRNGELGPTGAFFVDDHLLPSPYRLDERQVGVFTSGVAQPSHNRHFW